MVCCRSSRDILLAIHYVMDVHVAFLYNTVSKLLDILQYITNNLTGYATMINFGRRKRFRSKLQRDIHQGVILPLC